MLHTLRMARDIPPDRRVELVLPQDFPTGEAELVVVVMPKGAPRTIAFRPPATVDDGVLAQRYETWLNHDE